MSLATDALAKAVALLTGRASLGGMPELGATRECALAKAVALLTGRDRVPLANRRSLGRSRY